MACFSQSGHRVVVERLTAVSACLFKTNRLSYTYLPLKGDKLERWQKLCEQAATEQDPDKLTELANEIDRLLEEKEKRLQGEQGKSSAA